MVQLKLLLIISVIVLGFAPSYLYADTSPDHNYHIRGVVSPEEYYRDHWRYYTISPLVTDFYVTDLSIESINSICSVFKIKRNSQPMPEDKQYSYDGRATPSAVYKQGNLYCKYRFTAPENSFATNSSVRIATLRVTNADFNQPSCEAAEGDIAGSFPDEMSHCADIGGGAFCETTCFSGGACISTGEPPMFLHYVTQNFCASPDDPIDGGDTGGGDTGGGDTGGGDTGGGDTGGGDTGGGDTGGGDTGGGDTGGGTGTDPGTLEGSASTAENQLLLIDSQNQLIQGQNSTNQKLDQIRDNTAAINSTNGTTNELLSDLNDKAQQGNDSLSEIEKAVKCTLEGQCEDAAAQQGDGVALPDLSPTGELMTGLTDVESYIDDNINDESFSQLGNLAVYESIPQFFASSAQNCSTVDFYGQTLNPCPYTAQIRPVLQWVLGILTVLFLVTRVNEDIRKIRLIS